MPDPSPHVVAVPKAPPAALVAHDMRTDRVPTMDVAVVDVALAVQFVIEVCAASAIANLRITFPPYISSKMLIIKNVDG